MPATTENDQVDWLQRSYEYELAGDWHQALTCLKVGAKNGDSGCQVNLGNYLSEGRSAPQSWKEAARWYRRAYRQGYSVGALNLAIDFSNARRHAKRGALVQTSDCTG